MTRHAILGYDGHCKEFGPIYVNDKTFAKIMAAQDDGAVIVINRSWKYEGTQRGFTKTVKLSQTNSRMSGKIPDRVIWACW